MSFDNSFSINSDDFEFGCMVFCNLSLVFVVYCNFDIFSYFMGVVNDF